MTTTIHDSVAAHLVDDCVIALSGGVDSVVLLHAAVSAGFDVSAVHVDHRLRAGSAADAAFCADVARRLAVPFRCESIEVPRGNSTQGRARVQRYAALARAAAALGSTTLATAHHASDVAESWRLQSDRGAGAVGRAGPRRATTWWGVDVVRPLLAVERAEILAYAAAHDLRWREDPSNHDPRYARSRVRASLDLEDVPRGDVLRSEAERASRAAAELRARLVRRVTPLRVVLERSPAEDRDVHARALLDLARELHGELPRDVVEATLDALDDGVTTTRRFCGRRVVVEVSRDVVVVEATRGQGTRLIDRRHTASLRWTPAVGETLSWFEHRFEVTQGTAPRSFSIGAGHSLEVRGPRAGETIDGKKIRDILADFGVPPSARWSWPCFFFDSTCVWVPPVGTEPSSGKVFSPRAGEIGISVRWCGFPDTSSQHNGASTTPVATRAQLDYSRSNPGITSSLYDFSNTEDRSAK